MRVLLVQPPYDLMPDDERQALPPLGLAYIAGVLERAGHEVRIIDCIVEGFGRLEPLPDGRRRHGLAGAELAAAIAAERPEVVGVSCLFSAQAAAAHDVCRLVRVAAPQAVTVMGGAHPSAVPSEVLADPAVDAVVIGEGELTMLALVEGLAAGGRIPEGCRGLAVRREGAVRMAPPAERLHELDWLPLPARHRLPMRRYFRYRALHGGTVRRHPCTNLITSRGCPAQCCFCSIHNVWGHRFRGHSAARVLHEIETLVAEYGVREIQFEDDNLTLRRRRIEEICRGLSDRRLDVTWSTPNGVAAYALDEELLALMRAAGCHHITLGIESGSPRVLREIIRKPVRLERIPGLVRACRRLGLGVSAFFVAGFPGETRADLQQTLDLALSLDLDSASLFIATPYPGTRLYEQCLAEGLLRPPVDYARLRIGRPLFGTRDWTAAELAEWVAAGQARIVRRAARQHPVRFFRSVAGKFVREPGYVLRKALTTLRAPMRSGFSRRGTGEGPVGRVEAGA